MRPGLTLEAGAGHSAQQETLVNGRNEGGCMYSGRMTKKEDRSIRANLARHYELMEQFVKDGLTRDEASQKAYDIVTKKEEGAR